MSAETDQGCAHAIKGGVEIRRVKIGHSDREVIAMVEVCFLKQAALQAVD
jgi:hypothetical protein